MDALVGPDGVGGPRDPQEALSAFFKQNGLSELDEQKFTRAAEWERAVQMVDDKDGARRASLGAVKIDDDSWIVETAAICQSYIDSEKQE